MSVQRIDDDASHTHGWQVRAYTVAPRYLSRFFADRLHGSSGLAHEAARRAEPRLQRLARRQRTQLEGTQP